MDDQVQSVTTPMSRPTDGLPKAKHINEVMTFLGARVTDIFKMKIKITSNNNTVLIINTMLVKEGNFLKKAQIVILFVLQGGGHDRQ